MQDSIFYKRLDSYRVLAVLFVMVSHWLGFIKKYIHIGEIGVIMFFVLSGFLITNSLLKALTNNPKAIHVFFAFYARRFLRIFPVYYLVIIIFYFFFKDQVLIRDIDYYIFYSVNYLILKIHQWPSHFSHFWSLSIEEQFYLFWPLVIIPFFTEKSTYIRIILILLGLAIYIFFSYKSYNDEFFLMNTFYSSMAIIAGSLLSWFWNFKKLFLARSHLLRLLFPTLILLCFLFFFKQSIYFNLFFLMLSIFCSGLTILYLVQDENKQIIFCDWFWTNKRVRYLGKISYGIYLYHNFMPFIFTKMGFNRQFSIHQSKQDYFVYYVIYPLLYFLTTILISVLSWEVIEKPINNLKKYFNYS